ncbi:MAG: putative rRNA maturation factor [Pseudohongiellaceae bacterium]|jgi:probable rRNA maturation factor
MNVNIDILNESSAAWVPPAADCNRWITSALASADYTKKCSISIRFVDESESKELNGRFRSKDKPTNVLSFPANMPANVIKAMGAEFLGDIVICAPVLEEEALAQGKTIAAHWAHLTVHGTLHLLGFDHETDDQAQIMENLEIDSLQHLGFSNPYKN